MEGYLNNKCLYCLIDTGNSVTYHNMPVSFLDLKYFDHTFVYVSTVVLSTFNKTSTIDIYKGNKIMIKKHQLNTLYTFGHLEGYDILLHQSFWEVV